MSRIWQIIRRTGLEIYCFATAPLVVKNCLGMLTISGLLLVLTMWWLKCYTNHGESTEVPNFAGLSYKEALRIAKSKDFQVAITDSIYMEGKLPGEVLSQNPKAKSHVKEGRTIYFTIVKNNADLVTLPGLVGNDDYEIYRRQCERLKIKTRISARAQNARLEPNTILAVIYRSDTITTQLRRGYKIEMGATLDFVVSEAGGDDVPVPKVLCLSYDEARFIINSSGLSVGQVLKDATVDNASAAWVWKQSPVSGDEVTVKSGQAIDLYLTQDVPQGCQ
jgi:beta-lactam-binding protein with PASTA domain